MITLNIEKKFKTIDVKGKKVNIPKLGLRHHLIISKCDSISDGMRDILKSIDPTLSMAERDFVTLHLLHYNGKLKDSIIMDGITYQLSDVTICQKLKFTSNGVEYKFRTPNFEKSKSSVLGDILTEFCVSASINGKKIDIPDFNKMPAYVYKWVDQMCNTIELKTHKGVIKGLYNIMEVFDE